LAGNNAAAGAAAEEQALQHLLAQGLVLVERNYRVARGPSARGGEIDLILRDGDGTLVFVEVRERADCRHGGGGGHAGAVSMWWPSTAISSAGFRAHSWRADG
jgi:putative endonuclease